MPLRPLAALLLACCPLLSARAADADPREVVAAVAQAIDGNYYDATRGREIADQLRGESAKGEFDALRDPRDLATALTDRLRPIDRHFRVQWTPPGAETPAAGAPRGPRPPVAGPVDVGIRRVELQPGNIGYLEMNQFAGFGFDDSTAPARLAIDAALQLLANSDAVIIDLRDNGGGSPAMVGYLVSAFTAPGANIFNTFHSREGLRSEAPLQSYRTPRLDVPLYVLISARTGSAAEAFAYTLKNAGRATIVGEPSAGAANPGGTLDVGDGFSVFVSNGSPVSPITQKNWEADGVIPDLAVPQADALAAAQIDALQRVLAKPGSDDNIVARWALEALHARREPVAVKASDFTGQFGTIAVDSIGDALILRNGRRPPRGLIALGKDEFVFDHDPAQRVVFERDVEGAVIALEQRSASGFSSRFRRSVP
jgi:C-terminal processing protease CtpA/Prc